MTKLFCHECGKVYDVSVWPLRCACGNVYYADGREHYSKARGLGDTVAKITSKLGMRPCGGCKKRQELLNRLLPYPDD